LQQKPDPNQHTATEHAPRRYQSRGMEIAAEMSLVMARVPLWPPYTTQHKEQGPQQHPESQRWD